MKWISVNDRLPESVCNNESIPVLCYSEKWDNYSVKQYSYDFENWGYESSDDALLHPVTHWMPLPEPPEEI